MEQRPARTVLEQILRDDDYTLEETCERFDQLAREMGAPATLSLRTLHRWLSGEVDNARPASRRVAARLWGVPFNHLLAAPPAAQTDSARVVVTVTGPPDDAGDTHASAATAAHESARHAAGVGGGVDPMSIEQVRADVWRLARDYAALPPLVVLTEARQARDLAYVLLDRTRRPDQSSELYLAAGQLCALMTAASFDLAAWDAAEEQARAALVYGDLIGHGGLRAWARGDQALIAYWRGDPQRAVALALAALAEAPAGTPAARLQGIAARGWSHMGDAAEARRAITAADAALDANDRVDGVHDLVGELSWGRSRHAACAGSALLQAGDTAAAIDRVHTALELLPHDASSGVLAERAYCDLAGAEVARRDLDAAAEALQQVWVLPVPQRRHGVTGRLLGIQRALIGRPWHHDHQAAELSERIVVFNAEASGRALPGPA